MSDTPKTDAAVKNVEDDGVLLDVVLADFAREQERTIAQLQRDAERYRWLMQQHRWLYNKPPTPGISVRYENHIEGEADWIGEAIDAAIQGAKPCQPEAVKRPHSTWYASVNGGFTCHTCGSNAESVAEILATEADCSKRCVSSMVKP
jgi:hypothetical protein